MVMLDILRHGASLSAAAQLQCAKHGLPFILTVLCGHMSAQACNELSFRKEVDKAVLLFMAACCSKRYIKAWGCCHFSESATHAIVMEACDRAQWKCIYIV